MLFKNKKGLELPITAIIVLIIAITFLGLMIYFIKTTLTKGITGVETQFSLLDQQELSSIQQLGKIITFTLGTNWQIKKGTATDFKIYIKNNFANPNGDNVCYAVKIKCLQAMGTTNNCPQGPNAIVGGYSENQPEPIASPLWFTRFIGKRVDIPNNEYVSFPGTIQVTNAIADTYNLEAELLVASDHLDCDHTGGTFESAGTERFTIEVT